jgi:hypothetical protein
VLYEQDQVPLGNSVTQGIEEELRCRFESTEQLEQHTYRFAVFRGSGALLSTMGRAWRVAQTYSRCKGDIFTYRAFGVSILPLSERSSQVTTHRVVLFVFGSHVPEGHEAESASHSI